MKQAELTLCTYNIHAAVGRDGRRDPARIARVIEETDADIVALQEVAHHEVAGTDLPRYLARRGRFELTLGPTLMRDGQLYGNCVLSRFRAREVRRLDLALPRREPRGALDIELTVGATRLRVINTHLGLRPGERRAQVRRLLAHLEAFDGADVTLLMGDINEWFLWGRPVRWLNRHFRRAPSPPSFPAAFPFLALDRIWITPGGLSRSLHAHVSTTSRSASDHLPVCMRFAVPQPQ